MIILNRTILGLTLLLSVLCVTCKPFKNIDDSTEIVILDDDDLNEIDPNQNAVMLLDDLIKNEQDDLKKSNFEDLNTNYNLDDNNLNNNLLNDDNNNNNNNQLYNQYDFDSNLREDRITSQKREINSNNQSKIESLLVSRRDALDKKNKK